MTTANLWSARTWTPLEAKGHGKKLGWMKSKVQYDEGGTYLQTLDAWVPPILGDEDTAPSVPIPSGTGIWIVYIHGGAWRDPLVDSSSFQNTAVNILKYMSNYAISNIAGFISLNYRLSPHPNHPTHPAPPIDGSPIDETRTAKHPQHIHDILTALSFLQDSGVAKEYILAGHSCGATLAFQAAMDSKRWGYAGSFFRKPIMLVGLDGLYDVPAFIADPPASHVALVPVYEDFTIGAFGSVDESKPVWPVIVDDWAGEWPEGQKFGAVLVQSHDDKLVPYSQLELMQKKLRGQMPVVEMEGLYDHNELWSKGTILAEILMKAVTMCQKELMARE